MKIKLINFIYGIMLLALSSHLQAQDKPKEYQLTHLSQSLGIGGTELLDSYLSPLYYSGIGMLLHSDQRTYLEQSRYRFSRQSFSDLSLSIGSNSAYSANQVYVSGNFGWGVQYHLHLMPSMQLLIGSMCDLEFGVKNNMRNINNPVNLDMSSNILLSANFIYKIPVESFISQIEARIQMPIMGFMFIPVQGASYYEMFSLGNLDHTVLFSSLHNKQGVKGAIKLQIPSKNHHWNLGYSFQSVRYEGNHQSFSQVNGMLLVGMDMELISFAGKKNKAPEGFRSTNE